MYFSFYTTHQDHLLLWLGLDGSAKEGGTEQCSAHPQPLSPLLVIHVTAGWWS